MHDNRDAQLTKIRDRLQDARAEAERMREDVLVYLITMAIDEVADIENGAIRPKPSPPDSL